MNRLNLDEPLVMGILNVTPDSFFDGGKYNNEEDILTQCNKMITEGATIIDIGAYSSRPNAKHISEKEELQRILPIVTLVRRNFPEALISVDTFRSNIARTCIENGANIINDISGGTMDENMFKTIGELQVPYILMHMQGTPQDMQQAPQYKNIVNDVYGYLSEKVKALRANGVTDIIIDLGFGFGKTVEHNYQLLNSLEQFDSLELPMLVGVSRKSMINKVLTTTPENALNGTTVLNTIALQKGAKILRVHDVKEAMESIKLVKKLNENKS